MGVIYRASLRTSRMTAVLNDIDSGAGAGKLKIGTSGMGLVLATLILADPCGSVSGDVLTLDTTPALEDTTADATGTAAAAIITDSADTTIVSGLTVGTSGTNIILDSVSITAGQRVQITSATITHNTSGT